MSFWEESRIFRISQNVIAGGLGTLRTRRLNFGLSSSGGGLMGQESRVMLDENDSAGIGGVFLNLTSGQYFKLKR